MDERRDRLVNKFFGDEPVVATFIPGGGVMITLAKMAEQDTEDDRADA